MIGVQGAMWIISQPDSFCKHQHIFGSKRKKASHSQSRTQFFHTRSRDRLKTRKMSKLFSRLKGFLSTKTLAGVDKAGNRYFTRKEEVDGISNHFTLFWSVSFCLLIPHLFICLDERADIESGFFIKLMVTHGLMLIGLAGLRRMWSYMVIVLSLVIWLNALRQIHASFGGLQSIWEIHCRVMKRWW